MRKIVFVCFMIVMVMFMFSSCGSDTEEFIPSESSNVAQEETTQDESSQEQATKKEENTPQQTIQTELRGRIQDQYQNTIIDEIEINENAAKEGTYIALVHLTWNVKNSGKTSKDMLTMYSDDLAAACSEKCDNVQEIAIFWEVPYLSDNAKRAYERRDEGMYLMDEMWGEGFNE